MKDTVACNEAFFLFREKINEIADHLCKGVKGEFDFTITLETDDEVLQKLCLLINFVLDSARRALSKVRTQNKKLQDLDRLKSDFIANISHELRTPLTLLLEPLDFLLHDPSLKLSFNHLENLRRIQRNAARLHLQVDDLLDFAKFDAQQFTLHNTLFNLNEVITQLIDDAQGLAQERHIKIKLKQQLSLEPIFSDKQVWEKIILNLLSNALKFTPENGSIEINLYTEHNSINFTIKDSGIGIAPEHLPHIFERFYQIDTSNNHLYSGTGIGLALVKQFVELMHGQINVESKLGQGTCFTLILPQNKEPTHQEQEPPSHSLDKHNSTTLWYLSQDLTNSTKQTPEKNKKESKPLILIADDSQDMRLYMNALLEDQFDILLAENGKQALEVILSAKPQVILTDAMMPYMDGYQLIKIVKSNPSIKHIPIILITAKTGELSAVSGLEIGADDYLSKPFSPQELVARIQASLRTFNDYIAIAQTNERLEKEIDERKKLELKNNELTTQLVSAARQAGMADIATSVLHNIGNVLNSANISVSIVSHRIKHSKLADLVKLSSLLDNHKEDLTTFLTENEQGKHIIPYIKLLTQAWKNDCELLTTEMLGLSKNIDHIKNIIIQQQSLSGTIGFQEKISIPECIEHCIALNITQNKQIKITRDYRLERSVIIDKVKLMQIIVNLIKNSVDAIQEQNPPSAQLILRTFGKNDSCFIIEVSDNGIGIAKKNMTKLFSYSFTTKKTGHGFGLHASAISAQEMGGKLSVSSKGVGKGASFTLELPYDLNRE